MEENQLIELVKAHDAIYNTKSIEYRDASRRIRAWNDISRILGKPVEECKETWNRLRNCYSNSMKRRRMKPNNNFPPWRFESQMAFLSEHIEARIKGHQSSFYEETMTSPTSEDQQASSPEPDMKIEYLELDPSQRDESDITPSYKRKSSPAREISMSEFINNSHEIRTHDQDLDDLDQFFLCMSRMVKNLPKIDQIQIKLDLHTAICKAEMKQCKSSSET